MLQTVTSLKSITSVIHEISSDDPLLQAGDLDSKKVTYLPSFAQAIQMFGLVVGVIAGVAGYVFQQYALLGIGSFLALQSLHAMYSLNDTRYLRTIDDYIGVIQKKLNLFRNEANVYRDLTEKNKILVEASESTVANQQAKSLNILQMLKSVNTEMGAVSKQLQEKEHQIQGYMSSLAPLNKKMATIGDLLQKDLETVAKATGQYTADTGQWKAATEKFGQHVGQAGSEVKRLDEENEEFKQALQNLSHLIDQLENLIKAQVIFHKEMASTREAFRANVQKLDEAEDGVLAAAKHFDESLKNEQRVTDDLKEAARMIRTATKNSSEVLEKITPLLEELVTIYKKEPQEETKQALKQALDKINNILKDFYNKESL